MTQVCKNFVKLKINLKTSYDEKILFALYSCFFCIM